MSEGRWRKITVRSLPRDPVRLEELAFDVIDNGAASSVITEDGVECFVTAEAVGCFRQWCENGRIEITKDEVVVEQNWHAACGELWEPIELTGLRIVPVAGRSSAAPADPDHLMIIPGQGFGTGHHHTTRLLLEELVRISQEEKSQQIKRVADIGAGSGILALAAARLFGVPVDGVEIEGPAVENAAENIEINGLEQLVRIQLGESTLLSGEYELVLANIYGEVLLAILPEMVRLVAVGGLLCVSGISELTATEVCSEYTRSGSFAVDRRASASDWEMITFRRIV
jgi:ribosomal protein L11 methyltransferase